MTGVVVCRECGADADDCCADLGYPCCWFCATNVAHQDAAMPCKCGHNKAWHNEPMVNGEPCCSECGCDDFEPVEAAAATAPITDHRAAPGPDYWSWRCLVCSEPCSRHIGALRYLWRKVRPARCDGSLERGSAPTAPAASDSATKEPRG